MTKTKHFSPKALPYMLILVASSLLPGLGLQEGESISAKLEAFCTDEDPLVVAPVIPTRRTAAEPAPLACTDPVQAGE